MKNFNIFIALLTFVVLAGCGGGAGNTAPPAYSGSYTGGQVVLEKDRGGGGPIIEVGSTIVYKSDGRFAATIRLDLGQGQERLFGVIIGSISNKGLVTATVNLSFEDGTISIGGGPLNWQDNRGGPSRILSGPVAVIYRPAEGDQVQYLGSSFELWQ